MNFSVSFLSHGISCNKQAKGSYLLCVVEVLI
uniref:Uncharacterized protein n=1 Tax=Arundo donax TaxID=35708 RepID=A0A0A9GPV5_ARUDO